MTTDPSQITQKTQKQPHAEVDLVLFHIHGYIQRRYFSFQTCKGQALGLYLQWSVHALDSSHQEHLKQSHAEYSSIQIYRWLLYPVLYIDCVYMECDRSFRIMWSR